MKNKVWVDSRQQKGKHDLKHNQMISLGYELFEGYSSPFGDYSFIGGKIAVDTKKDILELANCLGKDHVRFKKEIIRAMENGIKLTILTEEIPPKNNIFNWQSPRWKSTTARHKWGEKICKMSPQTMGKIIYSMERKYGVKFEFCNKEETGKRIIEILEGK